MDAHLNKRLQLKQYFPLSLLYRHRRRRRPALLFYNWLFNADDELMKRRPTKSRGGGGGGWPLLWIEAKQNQQERLWIIPVRHDETGDEEDDCSAIRCSYRSCAAVRMMLLLYALLLSLSLSPFFLLYKKMSRRPIRLYMKGPNDAAEPIVCLSHGAAPCPPFEAVMPSSSGHRHSIYNFISWLYQRSHLHDR